MKTAPFVERFTRPLSSKQGGLFHFVRGSVCEERVCSLSLLRGSKTPREYTVVVALQHEFF